MKTQNATPRPWKIVQSEPYQKWENDIYPRIQIGEADKFSNERTVCDVWMNKNSNEEGLANAELIVRAVNNHEALLEACKTVVNIWNNERSNIPEGIEILNKAINKAETV